MFPRTWVKIIALPIVIAIVILFVYFVQLPYWENQNLSDLTDELAGTWTNESRNITITFTEDKSYSVNNNNTYYSGYYEITNPLMHQMRINWEGYDADYMYMFIEDELGLFGVNEPTGYVYLSKI